MKYSNLISVSVGSKTSPQILIPLLVALNTLKNNTLQEGGRGFESLIAHQRKT